MNTEDSKTNEPHRFNLDLTDKLNLKNSNKNMVLANLTIYYTWKQIKPKYNNNKFNGSYSISDIQDYFELIVFKIKTGYKLELFTPETMRLLGSTKKDVDSDKNNENVPKLESFEVVLVHCNLVKNDYQNTSKVLFNFVPNKPFGQLINISPQSLTMMNTVNAEFSFVEVWFKDQTSKALEIKGNVNLTLIIGQTLRV